MAYFDKVHKEKPHEEHPAKKSFLSRFKKTPKIPLLAPYGGEEGCGVNLAAVMSGMELYDLDVDPEERFCFFCFFSALLITLHFTHTHYHIYIFNVLISVEYVCT
jgi:hypothetical protein